MSDFKTEYPVLYFNEYFKRKPMRLNERESEDLFTLEETDVNNFEYISLHDHEKEIASLKELLERALPKVMDRKYARALDKKDYSEEVQWQKDYDVLLKTTQARREK